MNKELSDYENVVAFDPKSLTATAAEQEKEIFQGLKHELPPMPSELGTIAKTHWVFIGKQLMQIGAIAAIDLSIFRRYCENYELYVEATRDVKVNGEIAISPNGYAQMSAWAVIRERHQAALRKDEDRLGLSPAARKKIKFENPSQGELEL